jgi:hypothetical protein
MIAHPFLAASFLYLIIVTKNIEMRFVLNFFFGQIFFFAIHNIHAHKRILLK